MSYLHGLGLRIWTSFWRREGSAGMDIWNAPMVQSRQPFTGWEKAWAWEPQDDREAADREGFAESGSSRLSTLMTEIPGDLVWDLPCVQQASYLEGGPLMRMLPLYLHVNEKSDYDMINQAIWTCTNYMQVDSFVTINLLVQLDLKIHFPQFFC